MAKKTYNVLTVCDVTYPFYGIHNTSNFNQRDFENLDMHVNAPMLARETLLAQLLRTGKHIPKLSRSLIGEVEKTVFHRKELFGKLLGIEIEYYPTERTVFQTKLVENVGDGSLDDGGREIRKVTWRSKAGRLAGLLALNLKGRVNKTCGLHVHVDARHLGQNGLLDAVDTYERLIRFYPYLKSLCPRSRRANRYCRWISNRNGCNRYAAINFESFEKHGTIEFRCQGGSIDLVKIETWALLCQWLISYCSHDYNPIPVSWIRFTSILPEPLKTWCVLRKLDLYGSHGTLALNQRSLSGVTIR